MRLLRLVDPATGGYSPFYSLPPGSLGIHDLAADPGTGRIFVRWDGASSDYLTTLYPDGSSADVTTPSPGILEYGEFAPPCSGGQPACHWDLNGDQDVGVVDFLRLLAHWGTNPAGRRRRRIGRRHGLPGAARQVGSMPRPGVVGQ